MIKTPIGAGLAAAALLLVLSPEARNKARKWAVKATEMALDLSEQAKQTSAGVRKQYQSAVEETHNGNTESYSWLGK